MWASRVARTLRVTACRRSSIFFELYGRAPEPPPAEKKEGTKPALSCSTSVDETEWATCRTMLQRFHAQLYISPRHVPIELPRDTLTSLAAVLTTSARRRSGAASTFWKDALELRAHTPALDVAAAADTATVLLFSEKAALGYETCMGLLHDTSFRQHLETALAVEDTLRFLSVFVMCGAADTRRYVPAELLPVYEAVLHNAKHTIASTEKSKRSGPAHAVEVLAWSLDWLYGNTTDGATEGLQRLRPLFPPWLPFLFEPYDPSAAKEAFSSSLTSLSPRWLDEMARRAGDEGDHPSVEKVLRQAQRRESTTPLYRLFQLSALVAGTFVRCFPHLPVSTQAVETYGTALHCDALRRFGTTKDGLDKAVGLLTSMSGAEPYFELRHVMRQQSAETAATTQETAGDVLTGNPQLNWSTALAFTMHEAESGNPHWRRYLPETLRLLSDAGKAAPFWKLLQEYNAGDGAANLSVAASLAQMTQRSGKWWHAMEVLDLVAGAPPPRTATEVSLLVSACTDALRAPLHSKRWQEALEVFALVGDAVPARETAVVSQLLMSLPAGAPWESTLQLAKAKGFAVHDTEVLLRVLHDSGVSQQQLSHPQQRVLASVAAQRGRWDVMRTLVEHNPGDAPMWRRLLQALECCADAVDDAAGSFLLSTLPATLSLDARVFCAVAQLCLQHGWHRTLASYLRTADPSSASSRTSALLSSLRKEYQYLLDYVQTGVRPPLTYVFTDSYVVHQFIACVAARHVAVVAMLPDEASVSKKRAAAYLRVPHENLGTLHHSNTAQTPTSPSSSVKVYATAASAFALKHVLHVSADGFLFGYKVPGASLFASARGMLQTLKLPGIYLLAYNMSAASSGVFVLHPATTSLRRYVFTLNVRLCLANLADAPFVPLLATTFFKRYNVVWHGGSHERHEVEAEVLVEHGFEVKMVLRTLKKDINAEGWGLVETEPGAGDLYHVAQVRCAARSVEGQILDPQVVTCGKRNLQPMNADADAVSWMDEALKI
ncbi:putative mitochondrial hypothetical protein [Leptomonas pyrrhocoris]|uniref:Uncharacterized protein n=1 Tax=Leptomonas pyrrhocoris TaxID=157538 RepID=A0A0N1J4V0_LEPPY|nr:putative mitochondrial hypothetical protein [Leptomonas pyrrhocoris]KPA80701.1 putative mitochondrial hypothetical protein [Leptomonas pyrrhocoris]|eukprot:XP_015659140.1 putative mitochondrial hypothetical protein [Leptomonas pyrrhocoris]